MRTEQANAGTVRRMAVFTSVHRALESIFETLALIDAIKVPGYSESVARSTVVDKVEWSDRVTEAAWAMQAIDSTLTAIERAAIVARYHRDPGTLRRYEGRRWSAAKADDADQKHAHALALLKLHLTHMHAKSELLEAVIDREFVFGESYMPTTEQIAEDMRGPTTQRIGNVHKPANREIGDAHGVSHMAVSRLAQKVARAVRSLEVRAHAALKERFAELGFVPR
jgi:hypothetical protein